MARYDAQINLLVSGQRELDRLADRLRSIEKQIVDINRLGVSPQQRDPVTGRFGADPDRQNRVRLAGIQRIAREEERRSRLTSARLRGQNAELERSILLQSRLNSAVDLYERKLEELSRGGGGAKLSESLRGQIRDIQAAYDAATAGGTKNLSIVRSLATELGRVVERQNEINRLSSFQSKAFYDTQKFERRILELRRAGAAASEFGGVGRQIRELRSAQARGSEFEAKDVSRRIKESLDRIARELDSTIRQAKIENTARKAARSWEKFFEDAGANSLRLRQNQNDAVAKFRGFFEDAAAQALQVSQNAKETRRSWQSFFEDAATQALQISQNAKNTKESWQSFFIDAANQALQIGQNAKDTRRSWQEFFEDARKEADRLRGERLSRFARLRGRSDQYGREAGPLPSGGPGSPRYLQEARQLSNELLDVEAQIGRIRQESLNESLRLETKRLSLAKEYKQQVADVLLEAVTFGKGSQVKRVAKDIATGGQNALVRGGLGLGALGISGAYVGAQEALSNLNFGPLQGQAVKAADAIGNAINSSLGGIPEIVNQMLSALGNVPSSLGLATVAALAFAPAMKTAGDAVFLAGKKFGQTKFGENVKLTLNRQTNLFESAINAASQMTMPIDATGFEKNLEVRQSGKETADSWRSFFEEAAYLGLQLKQDSKDTVSKWADFFKSASYQALQISQNSKNTRKSWQTFFEDAAYEAFSIRQGSKDTSRSWRLFFENAAYEALAIRQNSKKTAESWRSFFEEAAYEAFSIRQKSKEAAESWGRFFADAAVQGLEIKQNLKKTADSWRAFFLDAASETLRISQEAKNTANNWKQFFETAAYQALQIKQNGKETSESWRVFFEDAAYEALSIKEKAKLTRSSWERFFEEAELEAKRLRGGSQTGLQGSLKKLQEARGARQAFLGGASPAEAIDKIVREFNKSASSGGDQGAAQAAENVVGTYAQRITAGVPAVADAMMKLGKAGIDAIKKALGIASPSIVMLAIAKNQIDTYVDFLRAAIPAVEAAAKAVGEAGTPKVSGVPESAIRKPITEKARTRPLTAEQLDRHSVIAEYAASQITGPMGQLEQVKRKIEDFIDKTRTTVDLDKLFGGQESERFAMATRGVSAGPEFDKLRSALADFYQVPAELTPDLERGVKTASKANASADELTKYVSELASGIEQIGVFLQSAAKLSAPAAVVDNEFTRAQEAAAKADAAAAEVARKKAEAQKPFEASIQRAAELDAEAKRKADAAVSSVVQAQIEADAKAGAEAISKSILDPIESAAPEGERQVRSAIGSLFDRVAGALGFGGGGGGGRPPVPPTGGGGPTRDPGDFNRRLSTAAEQGAEALLGLQELRDPTKATTLELEALSGVLKEFRKILDPTVEGFDRLEKQLRESAANLDRQLERRAPDAGFLTRQFGPRTARGLSEGLIGGAFPLLFGQGIGAAVGGAAGGFGGGFAGGGLGFGLSLVGTALGTAFDTAVQSAQELGRALEKPVENFDQLAQQSFFSSKALEDTIKKTIEYGDTATASALIQEEAIKKLGVGGVQNLKVLGTESDRLNRAFAELGQQMQAVAAGPLASVIGFFANIAGQAAAAGRVRLLRANLNEQQAGQFNKEILGRLKERGIQRGFFAPSTPTESEVGILAQQGALQDIVDKWQAIQIKGQIKIDPKQKIESEINALQKRLEAMDIGKSLLDQVRSANREQEDLDKQRADLVRSYEESIGNIRKQVEDKIAEERRKNAQLELDIRAAAADLQLEKIKEANREFRGIFSDTLAGQTTERILDAVETITQIQNDGASQRANLELQIQNTAIETEKYKIEIANQVAKLNEETARRVDDINLSVRRRNEEYDQNRFKLEKRIAELQLSAKKTEAEAQLKTAEEGLKSAQKSGNTDLATGLQTYVDLYKAQLQVIQQGQKDIAGISAPAKLTGVPVGVVGGGSVGTSGIDQAVNSGIRLQQALQGVQEQIRSVNSASALANIEESLNKQIRQAELLFFEFEMGGGARSRDLAAQGNLIDAINAKLREQQDKMSPLSQRLRELLQFESGRFKIINLINEATAADTQVKTLEDLISKENELKILLEEAKRGSQGLSEVDRTRLALQQAGLDVENDKVRAILDQAAAVDALNEKYKKLTADQQMQKELLDGIAGTFANTVGGAIDAAVSGTENFGEALKGLAADMLKTIARMLMMYAIAQALGALGGNDGVGFFSTLARGFGFRESANGSYFANGIAAFAKGGMFTNSVVSSPTLFKFADGGALSTGVMGEAGPEAIMPLKRGPGGRLGVDASGSGGDNIAVTVNVDAKGSSVQGDDQRGNQLGRAISAAVQQELIKQKRPGGLLA